MKKYIKENLTPVLIGFVIAIMIIIFKETGSDIIIKIALINDKS